MVEVKFVSKTSKDHYARIVAQVKFVSTTRKDQSAPQWHLAEVVRGRVYTALKNDKEMST